MERYELVEGKSSKFWEASVSGATLTIRYGRIGTQGQTKDKDFASATAAESEKQKLVKEKTGKGYLRVADGAAPASSPAAPKPAPAPERIVTETVKTPEIQVEAANAQAGEPDSETQPVNPDRQQKLKDLIGQPLPTRTRPWATIDAATVWTTLCKHVQSIGPKAESDREEPWKWLGWKIREAGEAGNKVTLSDAADVRQWVKQTETATRYLEITVGDENPVQRSAAWLCLNAFFCWLSATSGPVFVLEAVLPLVGEKRGPRYAYDGSSWSSPLELALREFVTATQHEDYDRITGLLTDAFRAEGDWRKKAAYAFILGDDRAVEHDLTPLAVLSAAEAAGEDIGASLAMMPLVLDARPSAVARWRTKRSYFIYYSYLDMALEDMAASDIATAYHYGESPLPVLEWLLHYGNDGQRTTLARIILATGEKGALNALTPFLHEKWIRMAIDQAFTDDPAFAFGQHLAALAAGSNEPVIRARIMDIIKQKPKQTLESWAPDSRSLTHLQKLLDIHNVAIAPEENLPPVLRDRPWRKKRKTVEDTILELVPLATPFRYLRDGPLPEENYWRLSRARIISDTEELIAAIREFETKEISDWYQKPRSMPLPQTGDSEENVLGFVTRRLGEIQHSYTVTVTGWSTIIEGVDKQPDSLALTLWGCPGVLASYFMGDVYPRILDRFGERAMPGLMRHVESDPAGMLEHVRDIDSPHIVPLAARALLKLKRARAPAMQWLRRYRRTAITRLIPDATGKTGPAREAAEHTLRWMVADRPDARDEIIEVARLYEAQSPDIHKAIAEVLDRDPLARFPVRIAKLPTWLNPGALTRPVLKTGGALPDDAIEAIAEMVSFSTPEAVYAGIDAVKDATTADSLARFSWDLFAAWLAEGAPGKDNWALRGMGWMGDDECARQLTRLIRKWPGEAAHQRAVTGLEVLTDIGTDVALMNLNGIAEKLKFKGLQEKAREKIAAIAEARDLTPEELADRLAPDLDLDERGGLDLDFGPRRFRVGFDEFLKPWVKDETGKRLKDLPKPNKSDDAALSAACVKTWAAIKKDARAVASLQITRLENMLSTSRRVTPEVFRDFFVNHPLIRHLTQRLVWGIYADGDPRTAPETVFRVCDDLSFTDAQDETMASDLSANAEGFIGLVHPLHLPPGGLDAWGALFGDYEISQPFPQLGREIHVLTDAEKSVSEISRFENLKVESARLRGMAARGWNLGAPQDGGCIWWLERPVRFPDGKALNAIFNFGDGIFTGGGDWEDKLQTLGKLSLEPPYGSNRNNGRTFGELDPVTASETLRGLTLLAETATT